MDTFLLPGRAWTRTLVLRLGVGVTLYMFFLKRSEKPQTRDASKNLGPIS